jgi:hypothetical protein
VTSGATELADSQQTTSSIAQLQRPCLLRSFAQISEVGDVEEKRSYHHWEHKALEKASGYQSILFDNAVCELIHFQFSGSNQAPALPLFPSEFVRALLRLCLASPSSIANYDH